MGSLFIIEFIPSGSPMFAHRHDLPNGKVGISIAPAPQDPKFPVLWSSPSAEVARMATMNCPALEHSSWDEPERQQFSSTLLRVATATLSCSRPGRPSDEPTMLLTDWRNLANAKQLDLGDPRSIIERLDLDRLMPLLLINLHPEALKELQRRANAYRAEVIKRAEGRFAQKDIMDLEGLDCLQGFLKDCLEHHSSHGMEWDLRSLEPLGLNIRIGLSTE